MKRWDEWSLIFKDPKTCQNAIQILQTFSNKTLGEFCDVVLEVLNTKDLLPDIRVGELAQKKAPTSEQLLSNQSPNVAIPKQSKTISSG